MYAAPYSAVLLQIREDLSSMTAYTSSSRLSADLGCACVDKEGADVFIVARDRSRYLAHRAVISCRSRVLEGLLTNATAFEGKGEPADAGKVLMWQLLISWKFVCVVHRYNLLRHRHSARTPLP